MRCVVGATLPDRDRDSPARRPLGLLVAVLWQGPYDRHCACSAPHPDRGQSGALARERVRRQELYRGPGPHRHPGGGVGTGRPAGHDHHRRRIAGHVGHRRVPVAAQRYANRAHGAHPHPHSQQAHAGTARGRPADGRLGFSPLPAGPRGALAQPRDLPAGEAEHRRRARGARELGALMSRARGGLACVVFALDADPADPKAGSILVRSARVSDVVGALSPTEFAVLAPGTDQAGAVKLAQRIGGALRDVVGANGSSAAARAVQIGYDAVPNLKYSPIAPVALLLRATTAVRPGTPEPGCSWMRRFDESKAAAREAGAAPRTTPSGLVRGNRGTGV